MGSHANGQSLGGAATAAGLRKSGSTRVTCTVQAGNPLQMNRMEVLDAFRGVAVGWYVRNKGRILLKVP